MDNHSLLYRVLEFGNDCYYMVSFVVTVAYFVIVNAAGKDFHWMSIAKNHDVMDIIVLLVNFAVDMLVLDKFVIDMLAVEKGNVVDMTEVVVKLGIHLSNHWTIRLSIRWTIRLSIRWTIRLLIRWTIHSIIRSTIHSLMDMDLVMYLRRILMTFEGRG